MDFEDFYNLTPGKRMARRVSTAIRSHHADWKVQQLTDICDYIVANPFVVQQLGKNIDVKVNASADGQTLAFVFSKSGT